MEKSIILKSDADGVVIPDDVSSTLKDLFSGCRVSFLLGAGFSADILGTLENYETIFEALVQYQAKTDDDRKKITILLAYMYWMFFSNCIKPIEDVSTYTGTFDSHKKFGDILYRIFSERGNPALDRQFNIFTTNYDPIIEMSFDNSNCVCNDGFEGRITPRFSTDNYSKSYYRQAVFSNRKSEIPSLNLIKLHGSLTWEEDIIDGGIVYQDFKLGIKSFFEKYKGIFDASICTQITANINATEVADVTAQITSFFETPIFDGLLTNADAYNDFTRVYKSSFLIVNPTKEKFSDTLLNKNYYELLRIFSNELEKENTLLAVDGFSFRDEHILDLVKRSMVNPSLKVLIFCYKESNIVEYQRLLGEPKNNNITYISIDGEVLNLERLNQILSCIHG